MTAISTAATLSLLIFSLCSISTSSWDLKKALHLPSHSTSSGDYCDADTLGIDGYAQKSPSGQHELGIFCSEYREVQVKITSIEENIAQLARTHTSLKIDNLERQLKDQQYKIDSLYTELASAWNELGGAITASAKVLRAASSIKSNGAVGTHHPNNQPQLPISADHGPELTSHMNSSDDEKHNDLKESEKPEMVTGSESLSDGMIKEF